MRVFLGVWRLWRLVEAGAFSVAAVANGNEPSETKMLNVISLPKLIHRGTLLIRMAQT